MANDIKLQEGHPVDENLRPIKVGGESTSLEVALENARIKGNCEVTGSISTNEIKSNSDYTRFNTSVGFDIITATYDATNTAVDFRLGNKYIMTFGSGNITNLVLTFPAVSGNFVLLLKQDGTGSRTISNYKVFDFAGNAATVAGVKFPSATAPDLTDAANHVDIISIFWDATNGIAYGVATLDFQD